MVPSPNSQSRARLIREMARDLNGKCQDILAQRSSESSGSSRGTSPDNTGSTFDPENDALMSTRNLDEESQRLPKLRASAMRYGPYQSNPPPREPEPALNSSALAAAFPDFTQDCTPKDDDVSIEIGRGGRAVVHQRARSDEFSSKASSVDDDESELSSKVLIDTFEVMCSPPRYPRVRGKKDMNGQAPEKTPEADQAQRARSYTPPSPPARPEEAVTGATKRPSLPQRRTLAECQARVSDASDDSLIGTKRPASTTFTAKPTRFSATKARSISPTNRVGSTSNQLPKVWEASPKDTNPVRTGTTIHTPANNTLQSKHIVGVATPTAFDMPDFRNVSTVVTKGTPPSGPSRFTNNQSTRNRKTHKEDVPVPQEEPDILVSLNIAQTRVDELEIEKVDWLKTVDQLNKEIAFLTAEKQEAETRKRRDSAVGLPESDNAQWALERSKLEAELTHRAATIESLEERVQSLMTDRDNNISQLGVARYNHVQLQKQHAALKKQFGIYKTEIAALQQANEANEKENKALRREIEDFKAQMAQLKADWTNDTQTWEKKKAALKTKLSKKEEAVKEVQELTQELFSFKGRETHTHGGQASDGRAPRKDTTTISASAAAKERRHSASRGREADARREAEEDLFNLDAPADTVQSNATSTGDNSESFLQSEEIIRLRQLVAEQRAAHQNKNAALEAGNGRDDTIQSARSARSGKSAVTIQSRPVSRKSSLKDVTSRHTLEVPETEHDGDTRRSNHASLAAEENVQFRASQRSRRRQSATTGTRTVSHRQQLEEEEASAFLLPDLTLRNVVAEAPGHAVLSENAQRVLDGIAKHERKNCTVCRRVLCDEDHTKQTKPVKVTKPIPVSERMPDNEDATVRPAQSPAVALAIVIKGLEDELAHAKMEVARYQAAINGHDASLGRSRRKLLQERLNLQLRTIDTKSDQIYALYDVVEGQKAAGQELTQGELEVTLTSIGVGDMSFPWEGFEE
ncbi:MAG: hypothetical protein M1833_001519 [Piccolia ochrophora]|nr:MAG: hypothetical protein M1833_001519 [Piccolia ochrophora]